MLTENQNEIINLLKEEFSRSNPKKSLIDTAPLLEKTLKVNEWKASQEEDKKFWSAKALLEMNRIIDILRDDLPHLSIEQMGKLHSCYESSEIVICKYGKEKNYEHRMCLGVYYETEYIKKFEEEASLKFGVKLYYSYNSLRYYTIEDAISSRAFTEDLRKKML